MIPLAVRRLHTGVNVHCRNVRSFCTLSQWIVSSSTGTPQENKLRRIKAARERYNLRYYQFPSNEFRIAGVSFDGRQSLLEQVEWGEAVIFEREPHNEYDADAVRVHLLDGSQLGYVPRDHTHLFGQSSSAGRLKSVGKGEGGYYGASVYVQPQLPCLLPVLFPAALTTFADYLQSLTATDQTRIANLLLSTKRKECHFTGLTSDLVPYISWRVHLDRKEFQISDISLAHQDVAVIESLLHSSQHGEGVELLGAVNGWTEDETNRYVDAWEGRRALMEESDWSADISMLEIICGELQLTPPMKLQEEKCTP